LISRKIEKFRKDPEPDPNLFGSCSDPEQDPDSDPNGHEYQDPDSIENGSDQQHCCNEKKRVMLIAQ